MPNEDHIMKAQKAVDSMCHAISRLAREIQKKDKRDAKNFLEALDSLNARARQAPQIMATWGFKAFLIYYASKAAEILEEKKKKKSNNNIFKIVMEEICGRNKDKGYTAEGRQGNKEASISIDATRLGYLLYTATLLRTLEHLSLIKFCSSGSPNYIELFRDTIRNIIINRNEYNVSNVNARLAVDTLARLITINLAPAISEIDDRKANRDTILDKIANICKPNT